MRISRGATAGDSLGLQSEDTAAAAPRLDWVREWNTSG